MWWPDLNKFKSIIMTWFRLNLNQMWSPGPSQGWLGQRPLWKWKVVAGQSLSQTSFLKRVIIWFLAGVLDDYHDDGDYDESKKLWSGGGWWE